MFLWLSLKLSIRFMENAQKIGADKIVYSERDMGQRVAHNLISNSIVDYIELSDTISLMSITVPPSLAGKT